MAVKGRGAVGVRQAGAVLQKEVGGRRLLASALVRVIVAVGAEVQARKDQHQREIEQRGERGQGPPVPALCATGRSLSRWPPPTLHASSLPTDGTGFLPRRIRICYAAPCRWVPDRR